MSDCIWMLRHGDTEWTEAGLHTGRAEPELSAAGREQAKRAGRLLAGHRFAQVLVSPQRRARETCDLAGFGAQAKVCPSLVEWDYGDYERVTDADVRQENPDWDLFADGAPGGETPEQIAARADSLLTRLASSPGRCLLVGHGKFLRALAARWIGQPVALGSKLPFDPAALAILEREDGRALLRAWNHRAQLPD